MTVFEAIQIFFMLIIVHCVADYPLQGDFLSKAKNHNAPIPGVPWKTALASHAAIHAGGVWLITGSWGLAFCEFINHMLIDYFKCDNKINFNQDQALHIFCKFWYVLALYVVT